MIKDIPTYESDRRARSIITGGSVFMALSGAAGLVLPVLGLLGVLPMQMAVAATIAMGIGLFIAGGALTTQYRALRRRPGTADDVQLAGGMTADVLGGLSAVTLGVLALLGASPVTLLGIATIVLGSSLLIGSAATAELDKLPDGVHQPSVSAAAAISAIVGLGAITLGVLVTAGMNDAASQQLLLVALLVLGAAELASGAAAGKRVGRQVRVTRLES
jgi:hypothetical protein